MEVAAEDLTGAAEVESATVARDDAESSSKLARSDSYADDMFTQHQTLSFVSPHAFGENARRTKAITDSHAKRLDALEAKEHEMESYLLDMLNDRLAQLMKERLGPFMAELQAQVGVTDAREKPPGVGL